MSDQEVDAMHERTEWRANIRALRALWVLVLEARRRAEESYAACNAVAAELGARTPREAWADPKHLKGDRLTEEGIYYAQFSVYPEMEHGRYRAPFKDGDPLPEGAFWKLTLGVGRRGRDGEPVNEDLGAKAWAAWQTHNELGAALGKATKDYEAALRACVEAP